jgi:GNAT superfamily N-acetyltransferase
MKQLHHDELLGLADRSLYQTLAPEQVLAQQPDAHWLLQENDSPLACCSLWWQTAPGFEHHRVGLIGHYQARQAEHGKMLLSHVCEVLAAQQCTLAIGPLDGNTWRRYRFVTDWGSEAPFFLEPSNPKDYPLHWLETGFEVLADYSSTLHHDLTLEHPRLADVLASLAQQEIRLRPLDVANAEAELEIIFKLSLQAFQDNFLYSAIGSVEFMQMYQQVLPYVDPELCLIAEADRPIGYLFALPDLAQAQRSEQVDRFIVKTLAVTPEFVGQGIASAMAGQIFRVAHKKGFKKAIHALMYEKNRSQSMSKHYQVELMRRYALFAKDL